MNRNTYLGASVATLCVFLVTALGGPGLGILAATACLGTLIWCVGMEAPQTTRRSGEGA